MARRAKGEGSFQHILPVKCKDCKDFEKCVTRLDPDGKCRKRDRKDIWRFQYYVQGIDGVRKRLALEARSRKELEAKVMKMRMDNGNAVNDTITLGQWCDRWCDVVLPATVDDSTQKNYRFLLSYIPQELRNKKLSKLTPIMVQELLTNLKVNGKKTGKGGLRSKSVSNIRTTLKACIQAANDNGFIATNVVKKTKPPRKDQGEISFLTKDEIIRLLSVADSGEYYDERSKDDDAAQFLIKQWSMVIRLTLATGMRRGEVFGLTWNAVNFTKKTVSIRTELRNGKLKPPKTENSVRTINVDNDTMQRLKDWKKTQEQFAYDLDDLFNNRLNTVFTGVFGAPVQFDNFRNRVFDPMVAAAGLPETIHMHSLRHTHATQLIAQGKSALTVSKRLGHSSVAFTLQTYVHVLENDDQDAADAMGAIMAGKQPSKKV